MHSVCILLLSLFFASDAPPGTPLHTRPQAPAGPLFETVAAKDSGVTFVNTLARPNHVPFINTGAGVALEDVDNDGMTDLYLLSTDGPNSLYRQTAPFVFEDITASAGVDGGKVWSRGAAFADVNGDGLTDLYVCNTAAPNLLYLNKGDGRFEEAGAALGLNHTAASIMAYFADYDRDGDLDLYLVTYRALKHNLTPDQVADLVIPPGTTLTREQLQVHRPPTAKPEPGGPLPAPDQWADFGRDHWELTGDRDVLFRNDGGTFTDVTDAAGLTDYGLGLSAAWLDYDNDGYLDLYVANDLTTPDRLWRNRGDGTFENTLPEVMPHTTWYSMGMDTADLNNDGLMDFMVADMAGSTHYRAKVGMGDMSSQLWFLTQEWPRQKMQNAVFLHTGRPRYREVGTMLGLHATDWTWAVKFGDLDNDGLVDLFTTNGTARDDMNIDLMGIKMMEVYESQGKEAAMAYMKTIPPAPSPDFAFRNTGHMKFENVSQDWGLDHNGISFGAAYGDLDGDGDLDLVVNHLGEPAGIYRNRGTAGNRLVLALKADGANTRGIGTHVRLTSPGLGLQVRSLLPARGFMSSDEPILHFGLADDTSADLDITWPDGSRQTVKGLQANRRYTLTQASEGPAPSRAVAPDTGTFQPLAGKQAPTWRHREKPFDDFALQPLLPSKLSQLGGGMAWGDGDGDGAADLFLCGAAGQPGALLRHTAEGFQPVPGPWEADAAAEDMAALWLDLEGDGDLDLFVARGSYEHTAGDPLQRDGFYRNLGKDGFQAAPEVLPAAAHFSGAAAAADVDGDGDLDLFVGSRAVPGRYPTAPISRLLRNEGDRFSDVTAQLAPALRSAGMVTSALFTDVDADGRPDLMLTLEWGPVSYFHNTGKGFEDRTAAAGLDARSGWYNSLTGGDFNGDGHMDYAVMNLGLNSKYKATPHKPAMLYYGDMDGTGTPHLIEAKKGNEGLLPVRGRSCSSAAMPHLAKKFPTFHDFAGALLPEIYQPTKLDGALRFQADTFESGILLGDGKGGFTWQPFAREAQTAPGYGVVASDFNGDGRCDLFAVQNFFTREPETGLLDGGVGLLLHGDGHGAFAIVSPVESGLMVVGDGTGLTLADLDGDGRPDPVAGQNDGPLLAWRHTGTGAGRFLAVTLRGPKGNPLAAGARLRLTTADGRVQTTELYAGGGYLSQAPPIAFFGTGSAAPTQLDVVWPDGRHSTLADVPASGRLTLAYPAD